MKNALSGLTVRPKRRAKGSPRTGETSADLLRAIPTPASGAPVRQPGWKDVESYDPQVLSTAAGYGITGALEGTRQLLSGARDYLGGFMQSVRERSPEELRGTAPVQSTETYDSVNRALAEAGGDPVAAARKIASAVIDVGKEAVRTPASLTEFIAGNVTPGGRTKPVTTQVVKPKGGDFLKKQEAIEKLEMFEPDVPGRTNESTLNNWLNTKLDRYIRTEMATPEDPIRKLAEQGILHVDPEQLNFNLAMYGRSFRSDLPQQFMAKSEMAKRWEGAADNNMGYNLVGDLAGMQSSSNPAVSGFFEQNPWIAEVAKKDPNRKLYLVSEEAGRDLGFDHLRDELFNSISPTGNLPQQLRLTPEQLGRMSVPDAVRHVSKINRWREKQKAEANFALANNAATVPFKDYPQQKYAWYQLKADTPEGRQALKEALRYEGDMMGHCVGGYCEDVFAGRSAIYSLRDKKTGAPHVTIEVEPYGSFAESKRQIDEMFPDLDENEKMRMLDEQGWLDKNGDPITTALGRILQIKGKANRKPKDEYIPFVQDFVKSQPWDMVQDLENTNLVDINSSKIIDGWVAGKMANNVARQVIQDMQNESTRFVTLDELNARHRALVKQRVAARKAAEPPEAKAARQQLRELRRAERRQQRGE